MNPSVEAKTFVVIFPHYWGKGATIAAAVKEAKKAGYYSRHGKRKEATVIALSCEEGEVRVTGDIGVGVGWPDGTAVLTWEQPL